MPLKQEFDEAREIVPELVARETKFLDFLRVEGGDPLAAAMRIASYWKCRKILFEERWLLPMNQVRTEKKSGERGQEYKV